MKFSDLLFAFAMGCCFGIALVGLAAAYGAKVHSTAIRQYKEQQMVSSETTQRTGWLNVYQCGDCELHASKQDADNAAIASLLNCPDDPRVACVLVRYREGEGCDAGY